MTLRRVPESQQTYACNHMVMDDVGFRFERERELPQALVAFNEPEDRAESIPALLAHFDRLAEVAVGQ